MKDLFNRCVEIVLKNEGGYVNHPSDPGGETNYGITKKSFPNEDIKGMTIDRAKEIYYNHYWIPMNLENIQDEQAALQMFDFGVNSGRSRAIKTAQRIVNVLPDGLCGTQTVKGINDFHSDFIGQYIQKRKDFYINIAREKPEMAIFLKGWLNRIKHTTL